jgi:hypothetical protein
MQVKVKELKRFKQTYPGQSLHPASLRIFVYDANFDCNIETESSSANLVSLSKVMAIYAGCPPYQTLEAKWSDSISNFCPNVDSGIPCAFFETGLIISHIKDQFTS